MEQSREKNRQSLIGTHIRLTSWHYEKAKARAGEKNISLAKYIRDLIEKDK